ncbi:hypothetical protein, partial [Enterocloster clostridioformis]
QHKIQCCYESFKTVNSATVLAFIKVVKSCVYIQHFYFIAKAGTPYSMRISSFLPLFNCRKRDYKAEDDKYQAISTFFLTFLLIFYTELFLLTEVISQPQENLTWKREFHLSYKLLADFTC